ncbi:MAG TPA: DegV family protein [Bacillota bacterium]|nr:DegV family protein [Bacillota bacterium]HOG53443.1 DegV family protein [Bacillota bacterium]
MESTKRTIGILTDSISDLPEEIAKQYGIEVIPVKLHIDDKTYLDKVDITDEQFFDILKNEHVHAKTSQPGPYDFQVIYERMLAKYEKVLSIHASSELSGTFQSAVMAREALGGETAERVMLFDTMQASMGEGMMVIKAAEMLASGSGIHDVLTELERIAGIIKTRFVPDTLTYLQRGGRIGKASAFVGNILNIKPLLGVDKVVYPVEKVRGGRNVVPKLLEQLRDSLKPSDSFVACILNLNMPEDSAKMESELKLDKRLKGILHAKVGATIGCHVGPKVIGLIWYTL